MVALHVVVGIVLQGGIAQNANGNAIAQMFARFAGRGTGNVILGSLGLLYKRDQIGGFITCCLIGAALMFYGMMEQ